LENALSITAENYTLTPKVAEELIKNGGDPNACDAKIRARATKFVNETGNNALGLAQEYQLGVTHYKTDVLNGRKVYVFNKQTLTAEQAGTVDAYRQGSIDLIEITTRAKKSHENCNKRRGNQISRQRGINKRA
jgi:hypothetical protein